MSEAFHERLRRLRQERNMTMRALAKKVSIPETTYREWERGRSIQGQPYAALAHALDVSLHELMTGEKIKAEDLMKCMESLEDAVKVFKHRLVEFVSA